MGLKGARGAKDVSSGVLWVMLNLMFGKRSVAVVASNKTVLLSVARLLFVDVGGSERWC